MPEFPRILAQRSAVTGLPSPNASADSFGGGIGAGIANIGDAISGIGAKVGAHEKQRKDLETKLMLSQAGRDWSQNLVDRKAGVQGDPAGFTDKFVSDFDNYATETIGKASSPEEADQLRLGMDNLKTSLFSNSLSFEAQGSATYKRTQIQDALDQTTNLIFSDPSQYETLVPSAVGLIEGLPGEVATQLRDDFVNTAATARFTALIGASSDPKQLDALAGEMADEKWRDAIDPVQFKNLGAAIGTQREKIAKVNEARAKASFNAVSERMDQGFRVSPAELDAAERNILAAGDEELIQKYGAARLKYDTMLGVMAAPPEYIDGVVKGMKAPVVDPSLMSALVGQESAGNPNAVSSAGAAGLTQVMPGTAREIASELKDPNFPTGGSDEDVRAYLKQPENGMRYGEHYLTKMLGRYNGDLQAALIAYNGGPLRADNWIKAGRNDSVLPTETSNYYKSVIRRYEQAGGDAGSFTSEEFIRYGAYTDAQTKINAGLKADPLAWANEQGVVTLSSIMSEGGFDPAGLAQRANDAESVADYYGLEQTKVFTAPELQAIAEQLRTATPEQKVELASAISGNMPADTVATAFTELKAEDKVFAFAGAMTADDKTYAPIAADIFRGQQLAEEAPDRKKSLGTEADRLVVFSEYEGARALSDRVPELAQNIRDAADALYISKAPLGSTFDGNLYRQSIERAMGGVKVAEMNGLPVVLPKGVSPELFEAAVGSIFDGDLAHQSVLGGAPVDRFGEPLPAEAIVDEGALVIASTDTYFVQMPDGYAVDSRDPTQLYRIKLTADDLQRMSQRGAGFKQPYTTGGGF